MESEAEEAIEMDEFEAFKFRACSPRLACKKLDRLDSEEEYDTRSSLPSFVSNKHDGLPASTASGDGASGHPRPRLPSPSRLKFDRLGSGHMSSASSRSGDNFRLGRSLSCRPRAKPKKVEGVSPMRGRDRIHSLVGELNALSRHGSLTGTPNVIFESGVEIYRVRSFTMTHKGIINRGDSFKIRSPACRRSLIKHRQDSRATLNISTTFALNVEGGQDEDGEEEEGDPDREREMLSQNGTIDTDIAEVLKNAEGAADNGEEEELEPVPTIYKVLLLGGPGVGKTALRQQFMTSEYLGNLEALPGKNRHDAFVPEQCV